MSTPLADVRAEARRIVEAGAAAGSPARVLGGVGVALHDHGPVPEGLQRSYGDIDIVVPAKGNRSAAVLLTSLGYAANDRFNALHGAKRMLFYDAVNGRQLDVFVGVFAMCHELDLGKRLDRHPTALDAADLLLTKLQIAEINRKDIVDAAHLLLSHELDDQAKPDLGTDAIAVQRLRDVTGSDWGWFTTFTDNLSRVRDLLPDLLDPAVAASVTAKVDELRAGLDAAPKSMRWKARSVVGRKAPWYELPEEVDRGATR